MKFYIAVFILLFSFGSKAQLLDLNYSVRAQGMGGAYAAIVDNYESVFYNPAGLAKVDGVYWTIFDLPMGLSGQAALDVFNEISENGDSLENILSGLYGSPVWFSIGGRSIVTMPYFAFGLYNNASFGFELSNPAFPSLQVDGYNDLGYVFGFGFPLVPGLMQGGITLKRIDRSGGTATFSAATLAELDSDEITALLDSKSSGWSMDLGINLTIPSPFLKPMLAFVWKDVGNTSFRNSSDVSIGSDQENMILSAALQFDTPLLTISPVIELRHLNRSDVQLGNKIHLGVEFNLPLIDIRGGFYQGYWSAGLGLSLGPLEIDMATYAVELGEYPGQIEDRRYLLSLRTEFGVGTKGLFDFGEGSESEGSSVRNRRLKQRR